MELIDGYYFAGPGNSRVEHVFPGPQDLVVSFGFFPDGPTPMA